MEVFVVWFVLALLCGMYAQSKGRSGFGFFLLAVILSPLIGFIAAAIASPKTAAIESKAMASGEQVQCPYCFELIKAAAIRCKHCSADLKPKADSK